MALDLHYLSPRKILAKLQAASRRNVDSAVGEPGKDKKPQKDPGEGQVKMLPQQATCPSWLCSQCLCAGSLRYGLADFVLLLLSIAEVMDSLQGLLSSKTAPKPFLPSDQLCGCTQMNT